MRIEKILKNLEKTHFFKNFLFFKTFLYICKKQKNLNKYKPKTTNEIFKN